jgi:hypothetical protein
MLNMHAHSQRTLKRTLGLYQHSQQHLTPTLTYVTAQEEAACMTVTERWIYSRENKVYVGWPVNIG